MVRLVVLIALALLSVQSGCSSVTLDPRKSEFWIGGTVDATDRARLARADSVTDSVKVTQQTYLDCVQGYALARAKANASPNDIADAAAAACDEHLGKSVSYFRESDTLRVAARHMTPSQQIVMRDRIEADVADLEHQTRERGRQLAIRAVIENRP